MFANDAPATPSDALQAQVQAANEEKEVPFLRMATWDIGPAHRNSPRDGVAFSQILKQFDIIALQGASYPDDVKIALNILNSIVGGTWTSTMTEHKNGNMAFVWRTDRVHHLNYERVIPPKLNTDIPILVATFAYNNIPFFMVNAATQGSITSRSNDSLAQISRVTKALADDPRHWPVFVAALLNTPSTSDALASLRAVVAPVNIAGSTRLVGSPMIDALWTNYGRPVRQGLFPFENILSMKAQKAKDLVAQSRPAFLLTTLETN